MSVDRDDYDDDTPSRMGRPEYVPNEYDEGQLSALLAVGFPHRQIAIYMKRNIKTLRKHYPELFAENTKEDKTDCVENALWYNAVYRHNVAAQIIWLKSHRHHIYGDKVARNQDDDYTKQEIADFIQTQLPN